MQTRQRHASDTLSVESGEVGGRISWLDKGKGKSALGNSGFASWNPNHLNAEEISSKFDHLPPTSPFSPSRSTSNQLAQTSSSQLQPFVAAPSPSAKPQQVDLFRADPALTTCFSKERDGEEIYRLWASKS